MMTECAADSRWSPAALSEHLQAAIQKAELRRDPFPHLFLEGVFPADFYSAIRAHLPRQAGLYKGWGIGADKGRTHYQQRKQIYIHNRDVLRKADFGDDERREFWLSFQDWFVSPQLQEIMLAPFAAELKDRFDGSLLPSTGQVVTNGMINFHEAGYFIGPHPDTPDRIVTAIFYLPEDGAPEGLGTKFYRPKDPAYRSVAHGEFEDFDLVSSAPYRPNTALLFLRTPRSYHGVASISEADSAASERFVIQYMLIHKY